MAATLNYRWQLPGSSIKAIETLRDKSKMRKLLEDNNFSKVNYALCNNFAELEIFIKKNNFPIIVKPVDGGGSQDVYLVNNFTQAQRIMEIFRKDNLKLLAEEFIEGAEYSVESFSFEGKHYIIAVTEKQTNAEFVEVSHMVPALLSSITQEQIKQLITKFLDIVGITNGPCHTEIKVNDYGIKIIESHNRLGGGNIRKLIKKVFNIDLIKLSAQWACRLISSEINLTKPKGYAIIKFITVQSGQIKNLYLPDEFYLKADPAVIEYKIDYGRGSIIPQRLKGNFKRGGYIIVHEDTAKQVTCKINTLMDQVIIEYI